MFLNCEQKEYTKRTAATSRGCYLILKNTSSEADSSSWKVWLGENHRRSRSRKRPKRLQYRGDIPKHRKATLPDVWFHCSSPKFNIIARSLTIRLVHREQSYNQTNNSMSITTIDLGETSRSANQIELAVSTANTGERKVTEDCLKCQWCCVYHQTHNIRFYQHAGWFRPNVPHCMVCC